MRHRRLLLVALVVAATAGLAVAALSTEGFGLRGEREGANDPDRAQGYFDPRKEAKFERAGREADRKGPDNPAAEQVDDRAYPLSYVDDGRAAAGRKAYTEKSHKPDASAFADTSAFGQA